LNRSAKTQIRTFQESRNSCGKRVWDTDLDDARSLLENSLC
jgi:hypothetical protein